MTDNEWFKSWFDTKYYHILYKHRDEDEAERFIERLVNHLDIPLDSAVLDLACGKGRHSKTLSDFGFKVTGADLSQNNISSAKGVFDDIDFIVNDMRQVIPAKKFDYVFNLFTSFGYFDHTSENDDVLKAIYTMLNSGGILVLDFMNVERVISQLVEKEKKRIDGIDFDIQRSYDTTHITKNIHFIDQGKEFNFQERVQALNLDDFTDLMSRNGFNILRTFGNLDLEPFNAQISDRLILIAVKNE